MAGLELSECLMAEIDETHDPELRSWVDSANEADCEFPIQNLPLASFFHAGKQRAGVRIGDFVLDLAAWLETCDLVGYFRMSPSDRKTLRSTLSRALRQGSSPQDLYRVSECRFALPCTIGDYTDFYASIHHARNVGLLFRPDNPLLPNYRHMPIAYHGRSSSIVVSGTPVKRPCGQLGEGLFGPSRELDYEVELGAFIGPGNEMGTLIPITEADMHAAGVCLLNDWSARDIQRWEYQPLGPFLGKNFATTISPWVVTAEALVPFRVPVSKTGRTDHAYLKTTDGALSIEVKAAIRPSGSREFLPLSRANFADMYWTFGQMIAHHTMNGCPLRPGDLIGSGTVSGPEANNRGCLLELTENGRLPVSLPDGTARSFLEDGDEILFRAHCTRPGFRTIGFGECRGVIGGGSICRD